MFSCQCGPFGFLDNFIDYQNGVFKSFFPTCQIGFVVPCWSLQPHVKLGCVVPFWLVFHVSKLCLCLYFPLAAFSPPSRRYLHGKLSGLASYDTLFWPLLLHSLISGACTEYYEVRGILSPLSALDSRSVPTWPRIALPPGVVSWQPFACLRTCFTSVSDNALVGYWLMPVDDLLVP